MKKQILFALAAANVYAVPAFSQQSGFMSAGGQWQSSQKIAADPRTTPVGRGYIVVNAEPGVNGAKLRVEQFQDRLNATVRLSLYAAISNGQSTFAVPVKLLTDGVPDAKNFYQDLTFDLDYRELQEFIDKNAPNSKLKIGPGTPLAVKADFHGGHNWGGFDRGGLFFLPTPLDQNGRLMVELNKPSADEKASSVRASALDVAYPISQELVNTFNDRATGAGLKKGGQVRSRLEGEGKFQILTKKEYAATLKKLIALANDPAEQERVFGKGWTFNFEDRYMKRDAVTQQLVLDKDGLPTPDPMVDTYMDNAKLDAASKDMAIRYRWTEGNQTGSWNFKPGIGRVDRKGVMYRIESGLDTTDDKPETIRNFADSFHPLNIFKVIRDIVKGALPSEFMQPSVKLEDHRYKFKLVDANNLGIEISIDDVKAYDLRGTKKAGRFFQLEMDIDHLSTASKNVANVSGGSINYYLNGNGSDYSYNWPRDQQALTRMETSRAALLSGLKENAFFDGRPVLHDERDLKADSPLLQSRATDFTEATRVIVAARKYVDDVANLRPGAQKYAYAAALLGLVEPKKFSKSVKKISAMVETQNAPARIRRCNAIFK